MKIDKGLAYSDNFEIVKALIPTAHSKARPQIMMLPKYITIHNTGNAGASARANSDYIQGLDSYKSWHFTIGPNEIFQHLPINEIGYHAGDGETGIGNTQSIGIEIAEVEGAEETAIKFIAELMKATNIPIDNIVPHKRWNNKNCPRLILPHWTDFVSDIQKELLKTQSMTLEQAKEMLQTNAQLDSNTMQYLSYYKYGDDLILKLAKAMD